MHRQPSEFMSPAKLQLFVAGLSGLAPEEVRKAKLLYIRNAISEFEAMEATCAGFAQAQGCMSVIPFFWPILGAQKKAMAAQLDLANSRIRNAIGVWRDDLKANGSCWLERRFRSRRPATRWVAARELVFLQSFLNPFRRRRALLPA